MSVCLSVNFEPLFFWQRFIIFNHIFYQNKIQILVLIPGIVILDSQGTSIENKGFFGSRVRKFKKMAVFASWTFELVQALVK